MLKKKVYIIDEVHMLSKASFNALLKIMEEPPSYLTFILATTEVNKIPETIISRTQVFNFKKLSIDDIT
jgi:DNA polymerase-3 subunit gamma/tau